LRKFAKSATKSKQIAKTTLRSFTNISRGYKRNIAIGSSNAGQSQPSRNARWERGLQEEDD
jgi:hypothetical protein